MVDKTQPDGISWTTMTPKWMTSAKLRRYSEESAEDRIARLNNARREKMERRAVAPENQSLQMKIQASELTDEKSEMAFQNKNILRIMERCSCNTATRCLEWDGFRYVNGYGKISINGKQILAHRAMFSCWHGLELGTREYVCHRCDNPSCCSIEHLFRGSPLDNMHDMIRKGRDFTAKGTNKAPLGEKSCRAKITDAQEMEIRALLKQGWTQMAILRSGKFPISKSFLSHLNTGRLRRHNFN